MSEPYKVRLGFDDYEKELLAKAGYTPESARDYVVKKLEKANLEKKWLDYFKVPTDKLSYSERTDILNMVLCYTDQPEQWIEFTGKDFSDHSNFISFGNYMDS